MKRIYILCVLGLTLFLLFNFQKSGLANTNYQEQFIDLNAQIASPKVDTLLPVSQNGVTKTLNYLTDENPLTSQSLTTCEGSTVTLVAGITGTITPPYSFAWTGPNGFVRNVVKSIPTDTVIIVDISTLEAGTYFVTITESLGGSVATNFIVNLSIPEVSITTDPVICADDDLILEAQTVGDIVSWQWYGPGFSSTNSSPTIPNVSSINGGQYTVIVYDSYNCSATDSKTISVTEMTAMATGQSVCLGKVPQLQGAVIGGTPPISYYWTGPNGFTSDQQNPTLQASTEVGQWTYNLTVTDANGCTATDEATIIVRPLPLADPSYNGPFCEGSDMPLLANWLPAFIGESSTNIAFKWYKSTVLISSEMDPVIPSISLGDAGTYTLKLTNEYGCEAEYTIDVVVLVSDMVATASGDTVCVGEVPQLQGMATGGTPPISYYWTGPNGFTSSQQNPTLPASTEGGESTYNLTVTDANGCTATDETTVLVAPDPLAAPTYNQPVYTGEDLTLLANWTPSFTGESSSNIDFKWYKNSELISSEMDLVIPTASLGDAGTYTLILTNIFGCEAEYEVLVEILTYELVANASDENVCLGEVPHLNGVATGGIPPFSYYWTGPNGLTSDQQNPTLPASTEAGEWTYNLTVTDANETTANAETTVTVHPLPLAGPGYNKPIYVREDLTLLASWTPSFTGESSSNIDFKWYKNSELISSEMDLVVPSTSLGDAGTYTLVLTNIFGCEAEYTVEVEILTHELVATANGDTGCLGETPQIYGDATGGIPPFSYSWTGPNGFTSNQQNPKLPASIEAGQWTYNLTVTDANETTASVEASVIVNPPPIAAPSYTGPLYEGDELKLVANPSGDAPYNYYWTGPNGFSSTEENPIIGPADLNHTRTYSLEISDAIGCTSSAEINVEVVEKEIGKQYEEVSMNYKEIDLYPFNYIECSSCMCPKEDEFDFMTPPSLISDLSSSIKQTQPNASGPPSCETQVNTFSGNFLVKVPVIDISGLGPNLSIEFAYNSCNANLNYGYGNGWTFNYNMVWEKIGNDIHIFRGDGRKDIFTYNSGAYHSPIGVSDTLIDSGDFSFILKTKYGKEFHFTDSTYKRLTKVIDRNNNELALNFSDFVPTKMTGACGRSLQLNYENGLLAEIIDDNSIPSRKISFKYDVNQNLVEIVDPAGYSEEFIYNKDRLITQLIDKNKNAVQVIYTNNHAVSSIKSAISFMYFEYDQTGNRTSVNRLVGDSVQTTDYTFDSDGRVIEINSNCCGSDVLFEYNSKNDVTRITDAMGNDYLYSYDDMGNVLTETDPMNNTQEFRYDPEHNQLIYWKDRNGNETTYKIDNKGNITAINLPLTVNRGYSYYSNGLLKSFTDGNGNITNYAYNDFGNLSSIAHPIGTEYFAYDFIGDRIQHVTPNRDTTHYEYDIRRQRIKTTDPLGFRSEAFYDGNGNKIWVKNKRGFEASYEYDAHNRNIKKTEPLETVTTYAYDEKGNLTYQKDPNGNETFYKYNNHNLVTEETNALGNARYWEYDANGNLIKETNFRGYSTNYAYDSWNRRILVVNALGDSTKYQYDANGNNTAIISPDGIPSVFEYDEADQLTNPQNAYNQVYNKYDKVGNLVEQVDALGNSTFFEYDANGRLTKIIDALDQEIIYSYDDNGNKIESVDKNGNSTYIFYNGLNQPITYINALGDSTKVNYDEEGNQLSITNERGFVTQYSYNEIGKRISIDYPIGSVQFQYDKNGNIISKTDALGRTTSFELDGLNQLIKTVYADGSTISQEFDENGNLISATNEENEQTTYSYNPLDQLSSVTNAENETTTYQYDKLGNLINTFSTSGDMIYNVYDQESKQIAKYDDLGRISTALYDTYGNITSESDGNGNTVTYEYDKLGQKIKKTDQNGDISLFTYDSNGNLIEKTDRENNTDVYHYDALNRLTEHIDALGNKTKYSYDKTGNLISITDANENITSNEFDGNNRLVKEIYADNTTQEYSYDDSGNRLTKTDNSGIEVSYIYDKRNRIIFKNYPGDNDNSYAYDAVGRLIQAQNSNAEIHFGYDKTGRLLYENLNDNITHYEYDNQKRTIKYPSGNYEVVELYDLRYRIKQIQRNSKLLIKYYYDSQDNILSQDNSNGTNSYYSYNSSNWNTAVNHENAKGNFFQLTHIYDKEGNKTIENDLLDPLKSEGYTYNSLYQLTGSTRTNTNYNYDPLGNRTQVLTNEGIRNYTTNEMNEYTSISGMPDPEYDDNGNLVNDGVYMYQYDYENHLVSVNDGDIAVYEYDALGRRIKKTTPSGIVNYYFDGDRVIEEKDEEGIIKANYIYATGIDDIQVMENESGEYFYHKNSLGSVIALSNESGDPVEFNEYDAYGNPTCFDQNKNQIENSQINNPYLFTGRRFDRETKLYYYRKRTYDPTYGRFLQRDPTGYVDGLNLYEYVKCNPVNNIDPFGLAVGFTHLGWKYGPVPSNALGVTNVFYRAAITCHCQEDGQYHMKVDTIEFGTSVFLKQNLKSDKDLRRVQGILGHENKHVESLRRTINSAANRFQTSINRIEKKAYGNRLRMCTSRIGGELKVLRTLMEQVIGEGAGHDNDETTIKPRASTLYDESTALPPENTKLRRRYQGYATYPWPRGEQW